jgi:hypothetical protein
MIFFLSCYGILKSVAQITQGGPYCTIHMSHTLCRQPPKLLILSIPRPLAAGGRGTEIRRLCSGGESYRRRGPREGEASGAHGGSVGPRVEGGGGRKGGSRWEPEVAAEGSTTTVMLWWSTSVKDLRMSCSE